MPAMATPYVVPKVPLSKSTIAADIQPTLAQPSISKHPCGSSTNYNTNNWCNVCDVRVTSKAGSSPSKKFYPRESLSASGTVCKFDSSQIDYEPVKYSAFKSERTIRGDGKNVRSSKSPENFVSKKASGATSKKLPNVPHAGENNPHEQYLKEVEALRGKLRELKGSVISGHRQLPEIPKDVGPKGDHKPVPLSVVKALQDVVDKSAAHSLTESKRIRHISDSECCLNPGLVYNAPKRPRDDSPKGASKQIPVSQSSTQTVPTKKEAWAAPLEKPFTESSSSDDEDDEVPVEKKSSSDSMAPLHTTVRHPRHNTPELLSHLPRVRVDDRKLHPSLRASLFSNIPPFVRFVSDTLKADKPFPTAVQRSLKWKLTTITPIIVKKIVQNSGYKFIRRTPDWVGVWGKHMKSIVFKTLKENQKLNHFPGTFQIGRKDRLWKNLQRFMNKHGKREFGFMPRTYVLPQDTKALRAAWDKEDAVRWIVKPPASARGSGIKVVNKWVDIPKKVPLIVQKYISNPYLINGNKFDLRLYVLVTSFDPLRIYIYENGLVRFASARYSDDLKTLSDRYIHLTNYSINKFSNSYSMNDDAGACLGHKWTLRSLWSFLSGAIDVDALWSSLVDLVIKTIICGESAISQLTRMNLSSRYCSYELFGVDVLLDENLKPWLLEVNISPSLHSGSSLDTAVKGPLVTNILNLVGYHIPDTLNKTQENEASLKMGVKGPLVMDHRIYVMGLSSKEKEKHAHFSSMEDRELYIDDILEDLTPDDVRHLVQSEDELTQTGNFQRIFPTAHTYPYHKFLEGHCYYNRLMDAWEYKFSRKREDGIALLRSYCDKEVHLDVSEIEPRSSSTYLTETSSYQLVAVAAPSDVQSSSSSSDTAKKSDELKAVAAVRSGSLRARRLPKLSVPKHRSLRSFSCRMWRRNCKPSKKPAK